MFSSMKKLWRIANPTENRKTRTSLLLQVFIVMLEDVLFWNKMWLSLYVIFLFHVVFLVCMYQQLHFAQFVLCLCLTTTCMDAIECWLKYKHRTNWLKRVASEGAPKVNKTFAQCNVWIKKQYLDFINLRETNQTKAYLLGNIILSMIFVIGRYINGYLLIYLLFMLIIFFNKVAPPLRTYFRKIKQSTESDCEFEGLIPEVSEVDIKLLSIEPEHEQQEDRQSLDWKPEDLPYDESDSSSENSSSSLVTNLSAEKVHALEKDVETSESSEDEYIPLVQQKEQLQSTLEVVEPSGVWGSTAYNALRNLTGTVANLMYTAPANSKKKRLSSMDSSDGFEIIDKSDLN